jgi:hypothetical protein
LSHSTAECWTVQSRGSAWYGHRHSQCSAVNKPRFLALWPSLWASGVRPYAPLAPERSPPHTTSFRCSDCKRWHAIRIVLSSATRARPHRKVVHNALAASRTQTQRQRCRDTAPPPLYKRSQRAYLVPSYLQRCCWINSLLHEHPSQTCLL